MPKSSCLPGESSLDLVIPLLSTVLSEKDLVEKLCSNPRKILGFNQVDSATWVEIISHPDIHKVRVLKTVISGEVIFDRKKGLLKIPGMDDVSRQTNLVREKALSISNVS